MEFGIGIDTHVDKWDLVRYAEELGYDRAWVPDSQMIWSDCYATLALAAANTRYIKLGTGVAIAGTRIAPVTAHSIATINRIAPGRTFLGIGTGHTAMRVMGQNPKPIGEFREYPRVVRGLLAGEAVEYTWRGRTREIQFLHRDRGFINLDDPIPIYVAANGPRACEVEGEFGGGWITAGGINARVAGRLARIRSGAEHAGRTLPANFHTTALTTSCVLRAGEPLTSERVIGHTGAQVTSALHFAYENWKLRGGPDDAIPPFFRNGTITCSGYATSACLRTRASGRSTRATALSCSPKSAVSSRPRRFAALAWSESPTIWSRASARWRSQGLRS